MNKLNDYLKSHAIRHGLCAKWQHEWNDNWSHRKLIGKFFDGIDFCIKNNYPDADFVKRSFDRDLLRECGVFMDDTFSAVNLQRATAWGDSNVTLRYNALNSGHVWVKDNSSLTVHSHNFSFVVVHLFGKARLHAFQHDKSKILAIRHSLDTVISCNTQITTVEELDYLK